MNVEFKKSFLKNLIKLKNKSLKDSIYDCIVHVESVENKEQIKNIKKLKGFNDHYRIRVGDYRIGVKIDKKKVYFVIFEHRKDIYKIFP
jgi:mRNA interferase RelE/StbE